MFSRRSRFFKVCTVTLVVFLLAVISAGYSSASSLKTDVSTTPVNFSAKSLTHDDENQTVTAIGNVELVQGPQILRADKMVYYLAEDKVTAIGNVSLLDEKGDVHFAQYVELRDQMKNGFIQGLLSLLSDGARFTAATAKRENGVKTTMTDATFTNCKVCENDPHPLWQIKAKQVVHNSEDKSIDYKHARLELEGVPIFYSPIFSHPDPSQKQKSGFLRPQYGWSTNLGTHLQGGYYYAVGPDKDATFQVEPTALAGTVFKGEWRERFANGEMVIDGNTVNSNRNDVDGTIEQNRQRGSIFANGLFDLDNKWRTGFDLRRASDKQYLGFYDLYSTTSQSQTGIKTNGVLTSDVYAERFSGRDYSLVSAMSFQDLRLNAGTDQPDILPMAEHKMLGEPNALWGGRWSFDTSVLGLKRNPGDQDVQRGSVDLGWERHGVSSLGFSNTIALDGRTDVYNIQNSEAAALTGRDTNPTTARGLVTASAVSSYPLVKRFDHANAIIEPIAGVNISPNVAYKDNTIPNEDSEDVQLDADNLFRTNRYPGLDRVEDGGRVNYGVRSGLYGDNGKYGKVFLGESYRLYGDPLYPAGSGLDIRRSDLIGQVKVGLSKYLDADYRIQVDSSSLAARRHEIQAGGGNDRFHMNLHYFFIKPVEGLMPQPLVQPVTGADFTETRQQIEMDGTYNFTKTWKFHASQLYDLGNQPGLRNAAAGLDYVDECFTFGIEGLRNVAAVASGDNDSRVMLRIGFKGIGEFSPGIGIATTKNQPN
jgi:LPS-assembly protein